MTFVQATTGAGGWPMSVWLTPELKPFFGGTYFPPTARWGRPGFIDVLHQIGRLWQRGRARGWSSRPTTLRAAAHGDRCGGRAGAGTVRWRTADAVARRGAQQFVQAFDRRYGGFGGAPKFPRPSELLFLLRACRPGGDDRPARHGARHAARDGARRHARPRRAAASTATRWMREWRVPHFEKMLYDQAQLVLALLEAAQATGEAFWRRVAADTLEYVRRDLTAPEGGFYSAEDADSVPPELAGDPAARRTEGAFYLWRDEEIDALLGHRRASRQAAVRHRAGRQRAARSARASSPAKNMLYIAALRRGHRRAAGRAGRRGAARARARPARRCSRRGPRGRGRTSTTRCWPSWNGLMIAAFARAARVLDGDLTATGGDARAHTRASASARRDFLARDAVGRRRGCAPAARARRQAAIDGYSRGLRVPRVGPAGAVPGDGRPPSGSSGPCACSGGRTRCSGTRPRRGWFSTTGRDPSVLLRLKEDYDGAEPAASFRGRDEPRWCSSHLVPDPRWPEMVRAHARPPRRGHRRRGARGAADDVRRSPLITLGSTQIVIVGPARTRGHGRLRRVLATRYLPFSLVVPVAPGPTQAALAEVLPWVAPMTEIDGRSAAYVCRDFACERPVTSPVHLGALLDETR